MFPELLRCLAANTYKSFFEASWVTCQEFSTKLELNKKREYKLLFGCHKSFIRKRQFEVFESYFTKTLVWIILISETAYIE